MAVRTLKATSGDTCPGVCAAGAVTKNPLPNGFPFLGKKGEWRQPVCTKQLEVSSGVYLKQKHVVVLSKESLILNLQFQQSLNEVILGSLSPVVDSKNGLGLIRTSVIPAWYWFCLCLLWFDLRQELRPW